MRIRTKSFGFKLWIYFIIFTALIFTVLWLMQTVFLQNFYDRMLINNTRSAAEKIAENGTREDINDIIDEMTHDNSILVFVTDTDGNVLYSSDEFKGIHSKLRPDDKNSPASKNEQNPEDSKPEGSRPEGSRPSEKKPYIQKPESEARYSSSERRGTYDSLPGIYDTFLVKLKNSEKEYDECYTDGLYIYCAYIDYYGENEKAVLYVSTTIDTISPSVSIIRDQLLWVTALSIAVAFVLSWFIARRFSKPVDRLSEKAKKIGEKEYNSDFKKGFCMELDELSDTLDKTNDKLNRWGDFQMEVLANVSHDLRTPVTMIKGYAEMIRDISWEDEKQCSEDIAVIIKEANRLTALVNEILEYSELRTLGTSGSDNTQADSPAALEKRLASAEMIKTDLSKTVRKTADRFETLYRPEDIIVEKNIEENIFVTGCASRLERALYNLMDNAFRHTDESRKISVTLRSEHKHAIIEIGDHGKGIDDSELEHIWERYYTSRMRNGHGASGLGLAIVKQITELHGGECSVVTEKDKGSTFIIRIPLL